MRLNRVRAPDVQIALALSAEELQLPENPFILVPYSPQWPADFRQLAALLRAILGTAAVRIDHIGSTAVPALCSKDVIDIQVTLAGFDDPAPLKTLTRAGFIWRPQIQFDHIPPGHTSSQADWERLLPGARRHAHRPRPRPSRRQAQSALRPSLPRLPPHPPPCRRRLRPGQTTHWPPSLNASITSKPKTPSAT